MWNWNYSSSIMERCNVFDEIRTKSFTRRITSNWNSLATRQAVVKRERVDERRNKEGGRIAQQQRGGSSSGRSILRSEFGIARVPWYPVLVLAWNKSGTSVPDYLHLATSGVAPRYSQTEIPLRVLLRLLRANPMHTFRTFNLFRSTRMFALAVHSLDGWSPLLSPCSPLSILPLPCKEIPRIGQRFMRFGELSTPFHRRNCRPYRAYHRFNRVTDPRPPRIDIAETTTQRNATRSRYVRAYKY